MPARPLEFASRNADERMSPAHRAPSRANSGEAFSCPREHFSTPDVFLRFANLPGRTNMPAAGKRESPAFERDTAALPESASRREDLPVQSMPPWSLSLAAP